MKKLYVLLLACITVFSLSFCTSSQTEENDETNDSTVVQENETADTEQVEETEKVGCEETSTTAAETEETTEEVVETETTEAKPDKSHPDKYVGKWSNGAEMGRIYLTFKKDGSAIHTDDHLGHDTKGTWTATGNKLTMKLNGQKQNYTYEGGKLKGNEVFEKIK